MKMIFQTIIPPKQTGKSTSCDSKDFFCPNHNSKIYVTKSYYNDMATLMFNSQESAIKQLFHRDGK